VAFSAATISGMADMHQKKLKEKRKSKKEIIPVWRECPNCGRFVKANAIRCVHCNYYFKRWITPENTQNIKSSYDTGSQDEDLNFKTYEDYKSAFCRPTSTKLEKPAKYCPKCHITFRNKEEKLCKFCKTKLIDKPNNNNVSKSQKTKVSKHNIKNNTKIDNSKDKPISIEDDSLEAEFAGKTKEELERELKIATVRYEDCLKCGDYMKSYYEGRKQYLKMMLNKY